MFSCDMSHFCTRDNKLEINSHTTVTLIMSSLIKCLQGRQLLTPINYEGHPIKNETFYRAENLHAGLMKSCTYLSCPFDCPHAAFSW